MESLSFWKNGICALNKLLDQLTFQRDDLMSKFSQVTTEKAKLKQEYEEKIQSQVSEIAKLQDIVALLNDKLNERNRTTDHGSSNKKLSKDETKPAHSEDSSVIKYQDTETVQSDQICSDLTVDYGSQDIIVLDEETGHKEAKENNDITVKQEINLCETDYGLVSQLKRSQESTSTSISALSDVPLTPMLPCNTDSGLSSAPCQVTFGGDENCTPVSNAVSTTESLSINFSLGSSNQNANLISSRKSRRLTIGPCETPGTPGMEFMKEPSSRSWSSTKSEELKCFLCSRVFNTYLELDRHQELHDSSCKEKEAEGNVIHDPATQLNTSSTKSRICPVCQIMLQSDSEYDRHVKTHLDSPSTCSNINSQLPVVNLEGSLVGQQFFCSICFKSFRSELEWNRHQTLHGSQLNQSFSTSTPSFLSGSTESYKKVHKCETCMNLFFSVEELQRHFPCHGSLSSDSGQVAEDSGKSIIYLCSICKVKFANEADLKQHQRTHNRPTPNRFPSNLGKVVFKCQTCHRVFPTETDMKRHVVVHNSDVTYPCDQCSEIFVCQYDLTRHYRVHTDMKNRRFKCSYCEKRFHYLKDKNRHEHVHTGYKPFQCDMCQKRFSRKDSLQTHLRTHSGEKPHHCEYCGKYFAQRSGLNSHIRSTHANEFSYKCNYCPKRFKFQQTFRAHLLSHSDPS